MSKEAFAPSRPSSVVGREVYDRGLASVLDDVADTLERFLIPTPEGRQPVARSWVDIAKQVRRLADEARGVEAAMLPVSERF